MERNYSCKNSHKDASKTQQWTYTVNTESAKLGQQVAAGGGSLAPPCGCCDDDVTLFLSILCYVYAPKEAI